MILHGFKYFSLIFCNCKIVIIANFTLQCKTVCILNNPHKPKDILHYEK